MKDAYIVLLAFLGVFLSGCLTVETKEYHVKLKNDHAGEATIRFVNIQSETDDTLDITSEDFQHLIDSYYIGDKLNKDNPGYRNIRKRLYEEKGMLVGEITFTFDSLSVLHLFRYDEDSPYMYFAGNPISSEHYVSSNGTLGAQWMPVVFWPKTSREFFIKTRITSEVAYRKSLLKNFQEWKARPGQKKQ